MPGPNAGAALPAGDRRVQAIAAQAMTFWDTSLHPTKNVRSEKLGFGMAWIGDAVESYDETTGRRKLATGQPASDETEHVSRAIGRHFLEPDAFVARLHEVLGKGKVSAWASRLIADNTNPSHQKECRGTMIIDQEDDQRYGWLNDLVQITGREAGVSDKELSFNGAGFLDMMYPTDKQTGGTMVHNAPALKVHSNLGLVTDGTLVGALCQVLDFQSPSSGKGTQSSGAKGSARPAAEVQLCLKADGGFRYSHGQIISLPYIIGKMPADANGDGDEKKRVFFAEGVKLKPKVSMGKDPNSNFADSKVNPFPSLDAFVKLKKPDDT